MRGTIDILDELQHVDKAPQCVRQLDEIHSYLMQVLGRAADEIVSLRTELNKLKEWIKDNSWTIDDEDI